MSQALDDAAVYGYASTDDALDAGEIFGYGASLAWRTGLLLPDNDALYATAAEGNVTVDRTIERQGRLAETQIAFGTMFQDRVSIGATLGLPRVSFEESSTHRESVNAADADLQDGLSKRASVSLAKASCFALGCWRVCRTSFAWASLTKRAAASP